MAMAVSSTRPLSARLTTAAPAAGLVLAIVALLVLLLGPLGYRAGWWHYRTGFTYFLPYGGFTGVAAAVVSLAALAFGWRRLSARAIAMSVAGLAIGLVIAYFPWSWNQMRGKFPPIHDITTDVADPPQLVAVVPARQAEQGNTVAYNPKDGEQQKQAYPDIAPVELTVPPQAAFERALETAKKLGWTIVASEPAAGHIEASQSSRWFGFTDDVAIRVTAKDGGSRVDVRSVSRQGRSDFGVNARRVREYTAALKAG